MQKYRFSKLFRLTSAKQRGILREKNKGGEEMEILPIGGEGEVEGFASFVNALRQFWHTAKSFQCIGAPKRRHLLLYLCGCRITYTDKEGRVTVAEPGDVVYTPAGSEYRAVLSDFRDGEAHTVGINFDLFGRSGETLAFSDGILVLPAVSHTAHRLFEEALTLSEPATRKGQILLLSLFDALAVGKESELPPPIRHALAYLTEHIEESPTVAALATECHLSEVHFRKLFLRCTGLSPAAYRTQLRLERARSYLEYGDVPVGEIAATLGYATLSHFIKEFKRQYGETPLSYRHRYRGI